MEFSNLRLTTWMLLSSTLLITGCASDLVDTGLDRNEEYNREFIKAFGVPSTSHNWSSAQKTSLTVKSTREEAIKVLYESEGQLFLAGDLTISSGSQQVPFIIPNGVTTLKVEANGTQYDVNVGTTLDLDNTTPSRAFATSVEYGKTTGWKWKIEYATDENTQKENYIRFTRDDLAKVFFDAFPLGQKNFGKGMSYRGDVYAKNKVNPNSLSYYIYPIFWSNKNGTYPANEFQLGYYSRSGSVWFDDPTKPNDINTTGTHCSPMCFSVTDASNYNNATPFYSTQQYTDDQIKSMQQAYTLDGNNITVQTQGIKITGILTPSLKFGESDITSANPHDTEFNLWKNRYWNLPLDKMSYAYKGMVYYMPSKTSVNFKVWRKQSNGEYVWEERSRPGFFIGFSAPPKENIKDSYSYGDDKTICDFCDAVYFVAGEDENTEIGYTYSGGSSSTDPSPFIIAAEDLGGSYDWDFNDAVFQVTCVTRNSSSIANSAYKSDYYPINSEYRGVSLPYVYQIEVKPLAAGGTMPIYIAYHGKLSQTDEDIAITEINPQTTTYNDIIGKVIEFEKNLKWVDGTWIIGTELHKWLGASSYNAAINVGEKTTHSGRSVKFFIDTDLTLSSATGKENAPLMQFSIIVDKNNSLGIDTSANFDPNGSETYSPGVTKFNGILGEGTYQISPVSEDKGLIAPQMFCIDNSNWEWPQERHNIKLAYPQFAGWVENEENNSYWHSSSNADRSHTVTRE